MIKVEVKGDTAGLRSFVVDIGDRVTNRRDFNQALAARMLTEIQNHWRTKNTKPNKLGGTKTNFWTKAGESLGVAEVTDDGAVVTTGDREGGRVAIHITGGTVKPQVAKALTIPIIREAHGLRADEYEQKHGDLFTIPKRPFLFEKMDEGGGTESTIMPIIGKKRNKVDMSSTSIPIAARHQIRPVYFLAKQVEIPRDPHALPSDADLMAALQEEAEDWFEDMQ